MGEVIDKVGMKEALERVKTYVDSHSGGGNANFNLDTTYDFATIQNQGQGLSFQLDDADGVTITASDPGTYQNTKVLATKDYVDNNMPVIVGSDWGVAKTGTIPSIAAFVVVTVDISNLNLSNVDDYIVYVNNIQNGSIYPAATMQIVSRSATQFGIYNNSSIDAVGASYVVIAKGYGSTPSGGTAGQVLTKKSNASGDVEWADGGGSGGDQDLQSVLTKGNAATNQIHLRQKGVDDPSVQTRIAPTQTIISGTYDNANSTAGLAATSGNSSLQLYHTDTSQTPNVNSSFNLQVRATGSKASLTMSNDVKTAFRTALGVKDPYETSTNEHAIGTFMGYPLYEKTIENVTIYNPEGTATFKDYKLANKGIPNNYTIVEYSGSYLGMTDSNVYVMPSPSADGGTVSVVMPEGTEWMIRNSTNQIVLVRRLTVRYVKENIL